MDNKTCIFCKRELSNKSNTIKHQKICKKNPMLIKGKNNEIDYIKLYTIIEEQKKENELLKERINMIEKNITIHKTQNNNNLIINTTQSIKEIFESLGIIDFNTVSEDIDKAKPKDLCDKGLESFAQFICDGPCKNKFITTDNGRKIIAWKNNQGIIINDPKAQLLQSTIIKQNAETIIDKTNERKQYYKSSIEQSNRFEQEPLKEDKDGVKRTNNFIKTIENIKKGAVVDDPNAIKVFLAKGIENKQLITNNALE